MINNDDVAMVWRWRGYGDAGVGDDVLHTGALASEILYSQSGVAEASHRLARDTVGLVNSDKLPQLNALKTKNKWETYTFYQRPNFSRQCNKDTWGKTV